MFETRGGVTKFVARTQPYICLQIFITRASPQEGRGRSPIDPRGDAGAGEKRGDEAIAYAMGIIAEGQDEARKAKMRPPEGSRSDVGLESNAST